MQGLPQVSVQWGAWSSIGECIMLCGSFRFTKNTMLAIRSRYQVLKGSSSKMVQHSISGPLMCLSQD